jgi:hypothetical protein
MIMLATQPMSPPTTSQTMKLVMMKLLLRNRTGWSVALKGKWHAVANPGPPGPQPRGLGA